MWKLVVIVAFFVFCTSTIFAQMHVHGSIYESELGDKLDSVTITIEGTDICSMSDSLGQYKITVPNEKAYLLFTKDGYDKLYVKVRFNYEIIVVLAPLLTETKNVDIGYGTQRSTEVTGSVASIGGGSYRPRSYVASTKRLKGKKLQSYKLQGTRKQP